MKITINIEYDDPGLTLEAISKFHGLSEEEALGEELDALAEDWAKLGGLYYSDFNYTITAGIE